MPDPDAALHLAETLPYRLLDAALVACVAVMATGALWGVGLERTALAATTIAAGLALSFLLRRGFIRVTSHALEIRVGARRALPGLRRMPKRAVSHIQLINGVDSESGSGATRVLLHLTAGPDIELFTSWDDRHVNETSRALSKALGKPIHTEWSAT